MLMMFFASPSLSAGLCRAVELEEGSICSRGINIRNTSVVVASASGASAGAVLCFVENLHSV